MRRFRGAVVIGLALLTQATAALALGFGRIGHSTLLGQQLDFSVVLTTDGSELPSPQCVTAEVLVGDNPLPSTQVRSRLDVPADGGPAVLRVVTNVRIDEPVASINVTLGCPPRLSRKFVVFIDPPVLVAPPTVAAAGGTPSEQPAAAGAAGSPVPSSTVATTPLAPPRAAAGTDVAPPRRTAAADAKAHSRPSPRAEARRPPTAAARPTASLPPRRVPLAAVRQGGSAPAGRLARAASPRLKLEADLQPYRSAAVTTPQSEPPLPAPAPAAASAAVAAPDIAGSADEQQRIRQLEQSLQKLLADARTTQASLADLQARLREAESARFFNPWVYGLLALVALLLAAVALLLWKQSRLKRESAWWAGGNEADATVAAVASPPEPEAAVPTVESAAGQPASPPSAQPPAPLRPSPAEPPQRFVVAGPPEADPGAAPFDPFTTNTVAPLRDMTVDELIDLEQQAEFFIVLGQDDAAIELLMGHVRHGGSSSPLAFLKLLEIYRRRGERAPYERLGERFNRRFNAYAPEWDAAAAGGGGRHLDSYPQVSAAIEAAWPDPARAMALLESLLFRRDAGAGTFDLSAYGEMLFLYSQARDVAEHDVPTDTVDLLLPIGEDSLPPPPAAPAPPAAAVGSVTLSGLTLVAQPLPMHAAPPLPSLPPSPSPQSEQPAGIDFDLDDFDAPAPAARR